MSLLELRSSLLDCLREGDDYLWRHDGGLSSSDAITSAATLAAASTKRHRFPSHSDFSDSPDSLQIGLSFLGHSSFLKTIYSHFSSLEARKCKLKLVASQPSGSSAQLPLIVVDDDVDGDATNAAAGVAVSHYDSLKSSSFHLFHNLGSSLLPPPTADPCRRLNEAEWALFRHAFFVVSYPILGRPQPPSASPARDDDVFRGAGAGGPRLSSRRSSGASDAAAATANDVESASRRMRLLQQHAPSQHDLNVSSTSLENDESDSIAAIPEETLTELLRSIFGLSQESFVLHQQKIREKIGRKSVAKILAEELCNQLFVLENNRHPFYSPGAFLSQNAYDQWQQRQRIRINSLFQKFWYQALPNLRSCVPAKLEAKHEEYQRLMLMLLQFEQPMKIRRGETSTSAAGSSTTTSIRLVRSSVLSSAALRLLQEFALRYGVGETFTRLVYLEYLVCQFDPVPWFLQHLTRNLTAFLERFPSHSSRAIITQLETDVCSAISDALLRQILPKTFVKLKRLFPDNKMKSGIPLLISLTSLALRLECFVKNGETLRNDAQGEAVRDYLADQMEAAVGHEYGKQKRLAMDHLAEGGEGFTPTATSDDGMNAMVLNFLLNQMESSSQEYHVHFQREFSSYFDLHHLVCSSFYRLFMEDVCRFATFCLPRLDPQEIDLQIVGLMFKLNQIDEDWSSFVRPDQQRWRKPFFHFAFHWTKVLKFHAIDLVLESLDHDSYGSLEIEPRSLIRDRFENDDNDANEDIGDFSDCGTLANNNSRTTPLTRRRTATILTVSHRSAFTPVSQRRELNFAPFVPAAVSPALPTVDGNGSTTTDDAKQQNDAQNQSLFFASNNRDLPAVTLFDPRKATRGGGNMSVTSGSDSEESLRDDAFLSLGSGGRDIATSTHRVDVQSRFSVVLSRSLPNRSSNEPHLEGPNIAVEGSTATLRYIPSSLSGQEESGSQASTPIASPTQQDAFTPIASPTLKFCRSPTLESTKSKMLSNTKQTSNIHSSFSPHQRPLPPLRQFSVWSNPFQPPILDNFLQEILKSNEVLHFQASSSVVDLIVLSLRLVYAVETFAKTICPISEIAAVKNYDKGKFKGDILNGDFSGGKSEFKGDLLNIYEDRLKMRKNLFLALTQAISKVIHVYVNNLICMDLCGTSKQGAKQLIDSTMIEMLEDEFENGRIWGCRHDLGGAEMERSFHECSSLDSGELLSEFDSMLLRICNARNLMKFVPWIFDNCREAFKAPFIVGSSRMAPALSPDEEYDAIQNECLVHVESCYSILLKLLANKTIEYIEYMLSALVSRNSVMNTIEKRLQQFTNYLVSVYENAESHLYPECLVRFFSELWKQIAGCFSVLIRGMFEKNRTYPGDGAETLLQSISYLIKFMNTLEGAGLELDFLTSEMEDNVFLLSLMTSPPHQLIILFLSMNDVEMYKEALGPEVTDNNSGRRRASMFTPDLPCGAEYLLRMSMALHQMKKCFSGAQMVEWIISHGDNEFSGGATASFNATAAAFNVPAAAFKSTHPSVHHIERQASVGLCQRLLDMSVIKVLPPSSKLRKVSSSYGGAESPGGAFHQAYPSVIVVSSSQVSRGFEDTLEFDPGRDGGDGLKSPPVVEKQEYEITKEMKTPTYDAGSTATSPMTSSSPRTDSFSSASSSLNPEVFHDRVDVFFRFTIVTYEEEELNFLTESTGGRENDDDIRFIDDGDRILEKIRRHFSSSSASSSAFASERVAAGSVQLEKCIMKEVTLDHLMEMICERACGGCGLSARFLRTMDADKKEYAKDILEKMGHKWKNEEGGKVAKNGKSESLLAFLCP